MLKKLIALGTFAAATVAVPAAAQANEPYPPKLPTQTQISVEASAPGVPIKITVSASANHSSPPEGDIAVQISAAGSTAPGAQAAAAAPVFTTTVHFVDEPIQITGPGLPKGRYLGSATLSPDNTALFFPSTGTTTFKVGANGGPGDNGDGGGLPDTGGPNLMWLLLGSGLVVTGAGSVTYARRRQPTAI